MRTVAETLALLEDTFEVLIALPPGPEQEAVARLLTGGDSELAAQALSLAAAHFRSETLNRAATQPIQAEDESGRLYGRYRTVKRIGSGGMGTVFLAERADGEYSQTAALKIIHPHLAPEVFHRRFLEERQILATLHHPGITKILDGGVTPGGTPFLVMDYVEGRPLDLYCAHYALDLRARLDLFRKVCEPVSYAHRSLIMHRDLKPSNILVTQEANPVLLDFGTARFIETASPAEHTAFPLLTLRYSSPEQRSRSPLTTATDVFSLGVILYELLTGEWPFGDASSPESLMKALGHETPIAAPALPGDLKAILAKALAPAPENRYRSVDAFSADVRNFLRGAPVNAKPASRGYRAGKFLRKHWLATAAVTIFIAGLSAAMLFAVAQSKAATEEARKAEKLSEFLNNMLSSGGNYNFDPKRYTVAQLLDSAVARLDLKTRKAEPLTDAMLRTSLGASYAAVEEPKKAKQQLEAALATYRSQRDRAGEAIVLSALGNALSSTDVPRSLQLFRQSIELQRSIGRTASPDLRFTSREALADMEAILQSDHREAFRLIEEAITIAAAEPSITKEMLAQAQGVYGGLLSDAGKPAQAEQMLREASRNFGPENYRNPMRSKSLHNLMTLYSRQDNFAPARDVAKEYYELLVFNLGPDHLAAAEGMLLWSRFRADTGQAAEALAPSVLAMKNVRSKYPPGSIGLWSDLRNLAHVQNSAGDFRGARKSAEEALVIYKNGTWSPTDPRRAQNLLELGIALQGLHRVSDSRLVLQEALAIYDKSGPLWAKKAKQVKTILASE